MKGLAFVVVVVVIVKRGGMMLLEDATVEIRWHNANKKKYIERGYKFTAIGDIFNPRVKDVVVCSSGVKIPVKCDYCGNVYTPTSRNYQKVHDKGELDCCEHCKGKKIAASNIQNYGVVNVMQVPKYADKMHQTCLNKYGVEMPLQNQDIWNKTQETLIAKYGVTNCAYIPDVVQKRKDTMQERYQCDYPYQNPDILDRVHQSYQKNGTAPTSKKQLELCSMLDGIYGHCDLNVPCDKVILDCVLDINGIKLDIEYDGWYWHKDRTTKDRCRDNFVKSMGYKILRIIAYENKLPTEQELCEAINILTTTNKWFKKIELGKC